MLNGEFRIQNSAFASRPDGWTSRGWASRLEYLAGQVEQDAERFGPDEKQRKLDLAARYRAAAKTERRKAEEGFQGPRVYG